MPQQDMNNLMQALGLFQRGGEYANAPQREQQMAQFKQQLEQQAQQQAQAESIKQTQDLQKKYPGMATSVTKEGASIHPNPVMATYDIKKATKDQSDAEKYSKRLEKVNDFSGTLQELEQLTNRDGSGGILTNPNAKLVSAGKAISLIPDSAIGAAESMGLAPKGSAEERKALARIKNEYAFAKSGARANPALIQMEKEAMGYMASGDPSLLAKGVRVLGRNMQHHVQTIKAGYSPDAQQLAHTQMGDPADAYSGIYDDNAQRLHKMAQQNQGGQQMQPQPAQAPKSGMMEGLAGLFGKTKATAPAEYTTPSKIRVKHKQSGQTGTINADEFDPNQYEQIQ